MVGDEGFEQLYIETSDLNNQTFALYNYFPRLNNYIVVSVSNAITQTSSLVIKLLSLPGVG